MAGRKPQEVEKVLNGFGEVMAKLMIDQQQPQRTALDLTLSQARMLRILRRGPLRTGQLAAELRISPSSVTQLTDRLIRKGLIERQAVAGDRRSVLVSLSAKGKRLVDGFRKRRTLFFKEALTRLDESEQALVIEGMRMVTTALDSYAQEIKERVASSDDAGLNNKQLFRR